VGINIGSGSIARRIWFQCHCLSSFFKTISPSNRAPPLMDRKDCDYGEDRPHPFLIPFFHKSFLRRSVPPLLALKEKGK